MSTSLADARMQGTQAHTNGHCESQQGLTGMELPHREGIPGELWEKAYCRPLRDFLDRPGKSFRGRLVECTWRLTNRGGAVPPDLPRMVEWIHAGSLIVDDIQDGSTHRRGVPTLHERYGLPIALNTGNSLYFLPLLLIERLQVTPEIELELHRRICETMLQCHQGQALDLAARIEDLSYFQVSSVVTAISELKTASLMELAAVIAPMTAAAAPEVVDAFAGFGNRLGIALQMLNDLANLTGGMEPQKRCEDLRQGRVTWPWAWGAELLSELEFGALREKAIRVSHGHESAEELARHLLELVEQPARVAIGTLLNDALDTLQHRLGAGADLRLLADEVRRLEANYA